VLIFQGLLLTTIALALQGCAAVGVGLLTVGAGIGTSYTLEGIAYRTFTAALEDVRSAVLVSVRRMDMTVESQEPTETGHYIVVLAGNRILDVELEKLTSRVTRMRVTARYHVFFRDRATAGEFIAQTEQALDEAPSVSPDTR
jgi:hypothetical protein